MKKVVIAIGLLLALTACEGASTGIKSPCHGGAQVSKCSTDW